MKQLEALKKRLPPGIDVRITSNNTIKFRACFRRTGHPDLIQTFVDAQAAKKWLNEQQRNLDLGIYLPNALASKRSFAEAVARYCKEELPKKGKDARNRKHHLDWWNRRMGPSSLALIRPSFIKETISILDPGSNGGGKLPQMTASGGRLKRINRLNSPAVSCYWIWRRGARPEQS